MDPSEPVSYTHLNGVTKQCNKDCIKVFFDDRYMCRNFANEFSKFRNKEESRFFELSLTQK